MSKTKITEEAEIDNIIQIIEVVRKTPNRLHKLKSELNENQLEKPIKKDEKSFKNILDEFLLSSIATTSNILFALQIDEFIIKKLDPLNDWGTVLKLNKFSVSELLNYFKLQRKIFMETLHSMDMDTWRTKFEFKDEEKQVSIYSEIRALALNEQAQLRRLQKAIKSE